MRKCYTIPLLIVLLVGATACSARSPGADPPAESPRLRHVVAFRFKPDVTTEQMQRVTADFHALENTVPQILEFEGGPDIRFNQKRENGAFTHSFMVTVRDEAALAAYGAHPAHQAFSRSADPLLAEVMVVDYWEN
jgi:hypothetical protein